MTKKLNRLSNDRSPYQYLRPICKYDSNQNFTTPRTAVRHGFAVRICSSSPFLSSWQSCEKNQINNIICSKQGIHGRTYRSINTTRINIFVGIGFFFFGFYSAICCFTFSSLPSIACFGLRRFSVTLRSCLEKTGRRVSHVWLMSPNNSRQMRRSVKGSEVVVLSYIPGVVPKISLHASTTRATWGPFWVVLLRPQSRPHHQLMIWRMNWKNFSNCVTGAPISTMTTWGKPLGTCGASVPLWNQKLDA